MFDMSHLEDVKRRRVMWWPVRCCPSAASVADSRTDRLLKFPIFAFDLSLPPLVRPIFPKWFREEWFHKGSEWCQSGTM